MKNILVCDDDHEIAESIAIYLSQDGYKVHVCHNGKDAINYLRKNHVDLLIMDIMMPGENGIKIVEKLRDENDVPVIFLSAKSEDADKLNGFDAGCDDYITKPYNPLELKARVKSLIRRGSITEEKNEKNIYTIDDIKIDKDKKVVTSHGKIIKLTQIEYRILLFFMKNTGKVLSSNDIYKEVWNESEAFNIENTVAVHIRHLREKIEKNPKEPKYIKVVWGIGYKMEAI